MKFKFKAQTCLVVAGLATTAYAATCFYQQTAGTTICFHSGDSVDTLHWNSGNKTVFATSDWNHGHQNSSFQTLTSVTTVTSGQGIINYSSQPPDYCYGPAKVVNPSTGLNETLSYWESGALTGVPTPPSTPLSGGSFWGVTNGINCP